MATKLLHRKSSTAGHVPDTNQLALGELAINTADGFIYIKRDDGSNPEEVYRLRGEPLTNIAVVDDQFTGDGSTTQFTLSRMPEDDQFVFVTINGVLQHTASYNLSNAVLTFTEAPDLNDDIEARVISVRSSALELRDYKSYVYSITGDTTTISGNDDNGDPLTYDLGFVEVYYNGAKLVPGPDFTASSGSSITLGDTVTSGDTIEVISLGKASFVDNDVLAPIAASLSTTSEQLVDKFQYQDYRSAKYFVQMSNGTDYHVTEVVLMHDDTNVYVSEYGTMYTNNSLGTVSADISGNYVRLLVTPTNATTTSVKGHRTLVTV
jgi:hypothetical protein